jgi:hypothetical protein
VGRFVLESPVLDSPEAPSRIPSRAKSSTEGDVSDIIRKSKSAGTIDPQVRTIEKSRFSARGGIPMPLPMKTLREVSVQLGMSEAEIRALVNLNKVRAVFKKSSLMFAPDEIAKIERQRRTLPESAIKSNTVEPVSQAKPAIPKKAPPPRKAPPPPRKFGP